MKSIALSLSLAVGTLTLVGGASFAKPAKKTTPMAARERTTKSGLQITELKMGTGTKAVAGKTVMVNYKGTFTNGKVFDQSYGRGPFKFTLGAGMVIPGWDEGVAGMKVGGKRKLVVPGKLAYGPNGTPDGTIPPNATLVFTVALLSVK